MKKLQIIPVKNDIQIQELTILANEIWHEHFPIILTDEQIDYMVDKFQSHHALTEQLQNGYEYFQLFLEQNFAGYIGIHTEENRLFLSKLYLKKDCRGQHLSTRAFDFLITLCKERGLNTIWLTCNKNNRHSLDVYRHLGFQITRSEITDIGNGYVMDDYILEYHI